MGCCFTHCQLVYICWQQQKEMGRSRGGRLPGRVVSVQDGFFQGEGFCVPDVLHFVQSLGPADIQLVLLKEAAVHDGPKFPGIFVRLGSVLRKL